VIAIYDTVGAAAVDHALANAVKKSVAQIDDASAKETQGRARTSASRDGRLSTGSRRTITRR
jgi:hypothetical protein